VKLNVKPAWFASCYQKLRSEFLFPEQELAGRHGW